MVIIATREISEKYFHEKLGINNAPKEENGTILSIHNTKGTYAQSKFIDQLDNKKGIVIVLPA